MWRILVLFGLCLGSLFVYSQYPESWRDHQIFRRIVPLLHFVGLTAVFMMFFYFPQIPDGKWKNLILFIETVYFMMICLMGIFYGIRLVVVLIVNCCKKMRTAQIRCHKPVFSVICLMIALLIAMIGFFRIDQIQSRTFDIDLTHGETEKGRLKAAVISDTHVGAGATHQVMDQMVENINRMDADVLFFVGDASDSNSSSADLEYLKESLKKIRTTRGIYYISGNHDKETEGNLSLCLKDAGVIILENAVSTLTDGVVLVGHSDGTAVSLAEILAKKEIPRESVVICLQHRPQKLAEIQNDCDLVVSGHTHGPRYPWALIAQNINFDNPEGIKKFGDMTSFTTTGVSAWGFHFKWPAYSETALLNIRY